MQPKNGSEQPRKTDSKGFAHVSLNSSGRSRTEAFRSHGGQLLPTFFTQVHRVPTCSEGIEPLFSVNTAQNSLAS